MTVRIEDLKVGMKVKLVDKKPKGEFYCGFNNEMRKYFRKVCTIREVNFYHFKIQEDIGEYFGDGWYWDYEFIEKIVDDKEQKNKVYTSLEEIVEQISSKDWCELNRHYLYGTSNRFKFKKCIVNNNCTIGIFRVGNRTYKGIAKCQPGDEFSLAKGLTIAMLRSYKDYLDKEIKKLY